MPVKKVMIKHCNFAVDQKTLQAMKILKRNDVNLSKFIRNMIQYYAEGFIKREVKNNE